MRSRYSAFYTSNIDYLIETLHPKFRRPDDRAVLSRTMAETSWQGLKIIFSKNSNGMGQVEFIAFFSGKLKSSQQGNASIEQLHELSEFEAQDGRWLYTQGKQLEAFKLGRNDTCYCGSGLKYKKCCC